MFYASLRNTQFKIIGNLCIFLHNQASRLMIPFVYHTAMANRNVFHNNSNAIFSPNHTALVYSIFILKLSGQWTAIKIKSNKLPCNSFETVKICLFISSNHSELDRKLEVLRPLLDLVKWMARRL